MNLRLCVALLCVGLTTSAHAQQPKLRGALKGHKSTVTCLAFSGDGKMLASSSNSTIKLWDVATEKETATLAGHKFPVLCVAFSRDGKLLASGSADRTIKLWDLAEREVKATLSGDKHSVMSLAFSPDGKLLASAGADKAIKLWDVAAQKEKADLRGHESSVMAVAFSPNGKLLASGSEDKTVKLWDVAAEKETRTLSGYELFVGCVAFSPDGKLLASGSFDQTIKLWDVGAGKEKFTLQGHKSTIWSMAFRRDGTVLASAGENIRLWDVATRKEKATLQGDTSVAFNPEGTLLAAGSSYGDKAIKLWEIPPSLAQNVTALVAQQAIAAGTLIEEPEKLFKQVRYAKGDEPEDAVVDFASLKRKMVRRALSADEPAKSKDFAGPFQGDKGMKIVTVKVGADDVKDRLILPGFPIDVVQTAAGKTEVVAADVVVLGMVAEKDLRWVVVEAKPEVAKKIAAAAKGKLSIRSRPTKDD